MGCKGRSTILLPKRLLRENIIKVICHIGRNISRLTCIITNYAMISPVATFDIANRPTRYARKLVQIYCMRHDGHYRTVHSLLPPSHRSFQSQVALYCTLAE